MSREQDINKKNGKRISAIGLVYLGLGSVIGGSFFLGSGIAIQMAGPSVVLGYLIGGVITYLVLVSLGHLALRYQDRESFRDYVYEAMGSTSGFVAGWAAWLTSVIGVMAEAIAMSIYTRLWFPQVPLWILPFVYILLAAAINFYGIKIVDRSEGVLTVIKTGALLAFIGVVAYMIFVPHRVTTGIGFSNLTPLFPRGIGGLAQATVICTFAYGLGAFSAATGDTRSPRRDIPEATFGMAAGQIFFFTVPTLALMLAVPWTRISTNASPFVSGLNHIGIHLGGSVLNAIVLFASFSALIAAMFSGVVMLASLAKDREAPTVLAAQWKNTSVFALLTSVVAVMLFSLLALMLTKNIYRYAVSITGYLSFVIWSFILLARMVLCFPQKNQGRMEWSGLIVSVLGLGSLLAISLLSLQAPTLRIPFVLSIVSLVVLMVAGKMVTGRKETEKADVDRKNNKVVHARLEAPSFWRRIFSKLRQK